MLGDRFHLSERWNLLRTARSPRLFFYAVNANTLPAIPVTDFIENKYVHLLKYEDYEVKEVE